MLNTTIYSLLLWNPNVYYHAQKRPASDPIRSCHMHLNNNFSCKLRSLRDQLLVNALNNTRFAFLIPPVCATCMFTSTHNIFFILLTVKTKLSLKLLSNKTWNLLDVKCRVACIFNLNTWWKRVISLTACRFVRCTPAGNTLREWLA